MVDEARDESMKEQMVMVFRYVDAEDFIYKIFEGKDKMEQTTCEIKIVNASCKRNEQLKVANANKIARLIDLEELETRSGLNQIGTLQRPVETRWSSHFRSVSSLLRMFTPTPEVVQNTIDDTILGEHRVEAESAYKSLKVLYKLNQKNLINVLHLFNDSDLSMESFSICQRHDDKTSATTGATSAATPEQLRLQHSAAATAPEQHTRAPEQASKQCKSR
ncbi:uncharacterized protein LOC142638794 [Castanea sativa]|uniref:uncharacterized protein LOC142638794 n=1 Tax=Castanea sativa TaxID=21020 RepID=UPI003F6541C9